MRTGLLLRPVLSLCAVAGLLLPVAQSQAGSIGWLDEVVQQAVREADVSGRALSRGEARVSGKWFVREADASLETLAKKSDDFSRIARQADAPTEAALRLRFQRAVRPDPSMARTFEGLKPAEKRLVVELGEAAQSLARRYPGEAEPMIRKLGIEGLSAVRAYGDDVAQVIVKEGPETIDVLRKTGRSGWTFFTDTVLPHKKKLIAAGVLAAFLANPQQFVDTAGNATQFAVEQFAKAGVNLAGAVTGGAARGLDRALASVGLDHPIARWLAVAAMGITALLAFLVLLGLPMRILLSPLRWPLRLLVGKPKTA
jgi:hypothetical protein